MDTPRNPSTTATHAPVSSRRRAVLRCALAGAASVGAVLGVGVASVRAAPERTRLRVLAGRDESLCHLPLTIAQQLGYFRAEGVDVEFVESTDRTMSVQALRQGQVDLVSGSYLQVVREVGRGLPLQSFVLHGRAPMIAMGVSARQMPGYRGPDDLRGRNIGVMAAGSLSQVLAQTMLSRAGLKPADVKWVGVGPAEQAALSMRSGEVQAVSHIDPTMTQLEQRGEVRLIADARTLRGTEDIFGGPMPSTCLFAPGVFVDRHPQTCQAVTDAVVRALRWLQTAELPDIIKVVPDSHTKGDRALYLASFYRVRECYSPDGMLSDEGVRTAWDVAARLGMVAQQGPDHAAQVARTFTNAMVVKARGKPKALRSGAWLPRA
jgi:NitT/TauT family transport system substrate-binding protein